MNPRPAAWLSLLLACTPAQPPAPPVTPDPPPAAIAPTPTPTPTPTPAPATCSYTAEPPTKLPALLPTDPATACRKPAPAARRALHAQIRKQFHRRWPKDGRLEIRDGCDRLDEQLDSVVFAISGGHGGSLTLGSFDRQADGDYALLLLAYNHYRRDRRDGEKDPYIEDSSGALHIYRATLTAKKMAPLLADLRAATHVEIEEHEPPPRPQTGFYSSGVGTSHDYHVALRLADRGGHGAARHFAGYEGSGTQQNDGVPLAFAQAALRKLIEDVTEDPSAGAIDTSDLASRALFARMFWDAHARGEDYGYWYVRERMLGLAALLGSAQLMPALLAQLAPATKEGKKDASLARSEVLALNAIAAITGHDLRHDPAGAPRDVATVAAETLAACAAR